MCPVVKLFSVWFLTCLVVHCLDVGIARFKEIHQQGEILKLTFTSLEKHVSVSSNLLLGRYKLAWKIHQLPVKMGADPCSEQNVGDCYECYQSSTKPSNMVNEIISQCIQGTRLPQEKERLKLPDCVSLIGQNGLVGRSIVITLEDAKSSLADKQLICSTIYYSDDTVVNDDFDNHSFMSTIAWFQAPYAGFIAFRKQAEMQSYIIVNLTRVSNWESDFEYLKWDIRDDDEIYCGPDDNIDLNSQAYGLECTNTPMNCAQGDLWRKHRKMKLFNNRVNLHMFIDTNLDSPTLTGKVLKLYKTVNGSSQSVVNNVVIEDLPPIRVNIPFRDESILSMLQRDPWSPVQHWYTATKVNTRKWFVMIYEVPTIQIFTGEMWECGRMWTRFTYLPEFQTNSSKQYLNQSYTFYGRDSIIYRGISIRQVGTVKTLCSTITYRKGEEMIGYSKLAYITSRSENDKGQNAIVLIIEHATLHQTTFLIASLCREFLHKLFFILNEQETCSSENIYNPYNVCPAQCSPDQHCSKNCGSITGCCSMCTENSSSVCPLGDFRRRLGLFSQPHTSIHNMEAVFAVKNDIDLPLRQMIDKYLGLRIYQRFESIELVRCGKVNYLQDSKITIDLVDGGSVTLSQKSPWQPLTVSWQGVRDISLKFWKTKHFSKQICRGNDDDKNAVQASFSKNDLQFSPKVLPYSSNQLSFFGPHSILGKKLTVIYKTRSGKSEETVLNIKPEKLTNSTNNMQCIYRDKNVNLIKFEFVQRKGHLTEETYISVEILHKKFCNVNGGILKWYLIDKKFEPRIAEGSIFKPTGYDDSRFFDIPLLKRDCPVTNGYNTMGDLSAIFGDIKLDGPGKIYRHDTLPLLQAQGHVLLLATESNVVIAKLVLKPTPKVDKPVIAGPTAVSTNSSNHLITILVPIAAGCIILLGTVLLYLKCVQNKGKFTTADNYIEVPNNMYTHDGNGIQWEPYVNTLTNKYVYLYPPEPNGFKIRQKDIFSGEEGHYHPDLFRKLKPEEVKDLERKLLRKTQTSGSMNGSTNGSTLNRSRATLHEENFYVTSASLPRTYHVNEDVSQSSLESSTPASSPSSSGTSRSNI